VGQPVPLFFGGLNVTKQNKTKQGMCHTMALPFTLKSIFKAKEELWKFKYFSPCKNIIFKKIPLK
jgi:hypothetical protein